MFVLIVKESYALVKLRQEMTVVISCLVFNIKKYIGSLISLGLGDVIYGENIFITMAHNR